MELLSIKRKAYHDSHSQDKGVEKNAKEDLLQGILYCAHCGNKMNMYRKTIKLAGRMTRSRQGKFCGGQPPLGLMRDPDDNGHLIIDPETAPVIRRIFDLALDGFGNMKICKVLMEERIPITRM